jgi:4-carboxymuconolactone decarboxylase
MMEVVMARTDPASRDSIPQGQEETFDEVITMRGGRPDRGPFSPMVNVPEMAKRALNFWYYLRGERSSLSLPETIQELAMLVTAREMDCQFIWNAHAASARRSGLRDDIVDSLRDKRELANLSAVEAVVVDYGREFFRTRQVSQATFDRGVAQLGVQGVAELTNLMGWYALLAFNANSFRIDLPDERTEEVLPI